jgi:hypothetical protein
MWQIHFESSQLRKTILGSLLSIREHDSLRGRGDGFPEELPMLSFRDVVRC